MGGEEARREVFGQAGAFVGERGAGVGGEGEGEGEGVGVREGGGGHVDCAGVGVGGVRDIGVRAVESRGSAEVLCWVVRLGGVWTVGSPPCA